ncbi:TPA: hypothetical protein ACPDTQ_000752 [Pasteurella multocida]
MKDKENFFREIRSQLFNEKKSSGLSHFVYLIEEFLKNLSLDDIENTRKWIDETIDMYYESELERAIEEAEASTDYYEDKDGEYVEYNKYLKQVWYDKYEPDIDLIINDFNVETRYIEADADTLEWLLKIGFRDEGLIDGIENYQIIAVMAIEYIERFIEGDSFFGDGNKLDINNAFRALGALISSERMKGICELDKLISKSKRETAQKAANARHIENNKMKEMVIGRWRKYQKQKLSEGKKPSKTIFAEKIFKELLQAHNKDPENNKSYSLKTIRNNWLQGIQ